MRISGGRIVGRNRHRSGHRVKAVLPHQLVGEGKSVSLELKGAQASRWGRTHCSRVDHYCAGAEEGVPAGLVGAEPPRMNSPDITWTPSTEADALPWTKAPKRPITVVSSRIVSPGWADPRILTARRAVNFSRAKGLMTGSFCATTPASCAPA